MSAPSRTDREAFRAHLRAARPALVPALRADLQRAVGGPGEATPGRRTRLLRAALPLLLHRDPLLGLVLYRCRTALQDLRIPLLPRILQRLSIALCRIYVGDPVVLDAGVRITGTGVVIDGITTIGGGTTIGPGCTIGLATGDFHGPRIGPDAVIGPGSKVIGAVRVGAGARIAPGSVVIADVAPGAAVAGLPARPE